MSYIIVALSQLYLHAKGFCENPAQIPVNISDASCSPLNVKLLIVKVGRWYMPMLSIIVVSSSRIEFSDSKLSGSSNELLMHYSISFIETGNF